jgi:hypothetical protein
MDNKTLNANLDNEMDRIINEVEADYSKFTLEEKYKLYLQGLFDLQPTLDEFNLNLNELFKMEKAKKKRDNFLIISNIICALAIAFVLVVEYLL